MVANTGNLTWISFTFSFSIKKTHHHHQQQKTKKPNFKHLTHPLNFLSLTSFENIKS